MKILIAGFAKTGTTGIFFKIRNSLNGICRELFESRKYEPLPLDNTYDILAKVLIGAGNYEWSYKSYSGFDKKIMILRDPRDQLISYLLYRVLHSRFYNNPEKLNILLEALRKKEKDPNSISVLYLVKLFYSLNGVIFDDAIYKNETRNQTNFMSDFLEEYDDFFILKYEDFIDNRLDELEKYLGFKLTGNSEVKKDFQRVVRTKAYNNWKNWFTEEDVKYFKPLFKNFMEKYDYGDDWTLNETKVILPEHCSGYVYRIVTEKIERDERIKNN